MEDDTDWTDETAESEAVEEPIPEPWIPPEIKDYRYGPIPGVPDDVMKCMPPMGMLHEYVWWATQTTFANPIYHVGAMLPILAWDLAQRGWSFGSRGKQIALQSFLIGDSSSGKSSALRLAKSFHEDFLARTKPGWQTVAPEMDPRTAAIAMENTSRINPWVLAQGTAPGILEQLFDRFNPITNTTPVILYNEEVAHLLERRKDHAIVSVLLELFDKVPKVERHLSRYREMQRKGQQPPNVVRQPAVSGLFAGTPISIKDKLDASSFEGGLVSRSLWFTGAPDPKRWFLVDRERSAVRQFVLERWIHYGHHHHGEEAKRGATGMIVDVPMSVKRLCAEMLFPAFKQSLLAQDRLTAVRGRALEHAELIAGLYAWSQGRTTVLEADMRAAVCLVTWSIRTVERIARTAGSAEDEAWAHAQALLEVVRQAGMNGVRRSQLYTELRLTKATLDRTIETLLDAGSIVEARHQHEGPGRPAKVYRIPGLRNPSKKVLEFSNRAKSQDKD